MLPIMGLLNKKEFVSAATSDLDCRPNAAPKMILETNEEFIYLVDYTAGKTWENLRVNPRISMSFADQEELKGYKINGTVEILEGEAISEEIMHKLEERKVFLSVERVIRGVQQNKKHKDFELGLPQKFVIYKIKIEEVTEIGSQGHLQRRGHP